MPAHSAIGIMQGRLLPPTGGRIQSFPVGRWAEEFPLAASVGLSAIEWIYEVAGAQENPLGSDAGIEQMKSLSRVEGVAVRSACADYFMDRPLIRASAVEFEERVGTLGWLIERCEKAGISRIVLPFVDASAIRMPADEDAVLEALRQVLPMAAVANVELHLETALGPTQFAALLDRIDHPLAKVNYDTGNSASLGYDPREEFAAYGSRIGSLHVKDRVLGGGTVPLGSGSANFATVFEGLDQLGYAGPVVLQVARGNTGDESAWAMANLNWLRDLWKGSRWSSN